MSESVRAVVNTGVGQVEYREIPVPSPGPGEVLIRVRAVGVCGSDIHQWLGPVSWAVRYPVVLGHEFAGVVEAVGPGVTSWKPGDRVVSETAARVCGQCIYCRTGNYNLCPDRKGFGYGVDGAMAEWVLARQELLHRIPDGIPDEVAALTEPMSVAFNAVAVKSRIQPGDTVVVLGPGPIGLLSVHIARLYSPDPLILVGTRADARRLALGRELGADLVLVDGEDDVVETIRGIGDGLGAHLVVDAVGISETVATSLRIVRPNGQITKLGWGPQPLGLSLDPVVAKAVTLQGSFSHNYPIWERVLYLVARGRLRPGPIVHTWPLEEWEQGFKAMKDLAVAKAVLLP